MKLGVKQMLPFEKNKEILAGVIRANPDRLFEIVETLRSLRWEASKREDISKLIAFVQEIERTGKESTPMDRDIEAARREFISQRRKPL